MYVRMRVCIGRLQGAETNRQRRGRGKARANIKTQESERLIIARKSARRVGDRSKRCFALSQF